MATESKHHARKSLSRLRNLVMPSKGKVPKVISPAPSPPVHDPNDRISLAISGEFGTPNKKHTDPQSSCLFLTVLPPELRQMIYTHVFVPTGNPQMHVGYYGSKPTAEYTTYICRRTITGGLTREYPSWSIDPSYDKYTPGYWERSLALSMTCREVQVLPPFKSDLNLSLEHWSLTAGRYTETIQLMYNTGTFVFEQRSIRPFLEKVPAVLHTQIRSVKVLVKDGFVVGIHPEWTWHVFEEKSPSGPWDLFFDVEERCGTD